MINSCDNYLDTYRPRIAASSSPSMMCVSLHGLRTVGKPTLLDGTSPT